MPYIKTSWGCIYDYQRFLDTHTEMSYSSMCDGTIHKTCVCENGVRFPFYFEVTFLRLQVLLGQCLEYMSEEI